MNILKKMICSIMVVFSCMLSIIPTSVYAEEDTAAKLETFITSCYENGYMNSTIRVEQLTNKKYELSFVYKENIKGMDLGFYVYPSVCETLTDLGFTYDTYVDNNYAYVSFTRVTDNLHYDLQRISILPYITVEAYIDEETKANVIKGQFLEDFYKEERAENELVNDILSTNYFSFEYKPVDKENFRSNAPFTNEDGYFVWYWTGDKICVIEGISQPISEGLMITLKIILSIISIVAIVGIVFFIRKIVSDKKNKNYNNFNYNNYNDYY